MDITMSVMDGGEATKYVKYTTKANATAIIALRASVVEEERAITLSAGCKEHIIFATLTKHLGGKYIYEEMQSHNGDNLTKAEAKSETFKVSRSAELN